MPPVLFKAVKEVSGAIARYITSPPRRVPDVGQVLDLAEGDVRYVDLPMRIRVSRPRTDLSWWYGGDWVWVQAEVLGDGDELLDVRALLIRVDAIPEPTPETTPETNEEGGGERRGEGQRSVQGMQRQGRRADDSAG